MQSIPRELTITPSNVYYLDAVKVSQAEKEASAENKPDKKDSEAQSADSDKEPSEQIATYKRREAEDAIKTKASWTCSKIWSTTGRSRYGFSVWRRPNISAPPRPTSTCTLKTRPSF